MSIKMLKIFFYKTDFEGCYIVISDTVKPQNCIFDKCIDSKEKLLKIA